MAQKKLFRFNAIKSFTNVLEYPQNMQGAWNRFFKNENPIVLELACGRGEYTTGMAKLFPDKNFIGIDIKGNRMYLGAKKALESSLSNAAFLRSQIEKLTDYFSPGEISEIWILFPDPHLRLSKAKKRLTHPRFLKLYQQVLTTAGSIHLKTDSPELFDFTNKVIDLFDLTLLKKSDNVYSSELLNDTLRIKTHYEGLDIAQSRRVFYLEFSLPLPIPDRAGALMELIKAETSTS